MSAALATETFNMNFMRRLQLSGCSGSRLRKRRRACQLYDNLKTKKTAKACALAVVEHAAEAAVSLT